MVHAGGLDQLSQIAQELVAFPNWRGLSIFFEKRARGLREAAFAALDEFLGFSEDWPFEERLHLTCWLADQCGRVEDDTLLFPQPLLARLVSPTLWDWIRRKPLSAEAHYLLAILAIWPPDELSPDRQSHLMRAIVLDPDHDRAREKLVQWLTGEVEYKQHELPEFYIGDVETDIADLGQAEIVANGICDPKLRAWAQDDVRRLRDVARSWLAFRRSGKTDFAAWCSEQTTGPSA